MLRLRNPGMLLFHQTRSSPWIPTLTPATQADITNPSQISCSMDQEALGFPLSSRWLLPVGQSSAWTCPP